jgi:hypothetical protein
MPQDSDVESDMELPFDLKIAAKVSDFKRLLDRHKRQLQPKIDSLNEDRRQLETVLLRLS